MFYYEYHEIKELHTNEKTFYRKKETNSVLVLRLFNNVIRISCRSINYSSKYIIIFYDMIFTSFIKR